MLKINTKIYSPIKIEIDGQVIEAKKITNDVLMAALELGRKLTAQGTTPEEIFDTTMEILMLYLPVEKEWIRKSLTPGQTRQIADYIIDESQKVEEPPLAGGPGGDASPK
jgi:hypothetical protein